MTTTITHNMILNGSKNTWEKAFLEISPYFPRGKVKSTFSFYNFLLFSNNIFHLFFEPSENLFTRETNRHVEVLCHFDLGLCSHSFFFLIVWSELLSIVCFCFARFPFRPFYFLAPQRLYFSCLSWYSKQLQANIHNLKCCGDRFTSLSKMSEFILAFNFLPLSFKEKQGENVTVSQ